MAIRFSPREITIIILSAVLYAVAIAITASIPTPWGVGHFRPGVVVPAFFAVVYGPWIAGLGAALGSFLGSFILTAVGTGLGPIASLVSGSPGNFVGFYLLGWFVSKYRSWRAFILGSLASIFVGNLVAASGVMVWLTFFVPTWASWPLDVKLAAILGLTLFWTVTMQPFVVSVVPILLKAVTPFFSKSAKSTALSWKKLSDILYPSLLVAVILGVLFTWVAFTPLGDILFAKVVRPEFTFWVKALFLITAFVMIIFGFTASMLISRTKNQRNRL